MRVDHMTNDQLRAVLKRGCQADPVFRQCVPASLVAKTIDEVVERVLVRIRKARRGGRNPWVTRARRTR